MKRVIVVVPLCLLETTAKVTMLGLGLGMTTATMRIGVYLSLSGKHQAPAKGVAIGLSCYWQVQWTLTNQYRTALSICESIYLQESKGKQRSKEGHWNICVELNCIELDPKTHPSSHGNQMYIISYYSTRPNPQCGQMFADLPGGTSEEGRGPRWITNGLVRQPQVAQMRTRRRPE